MQAALPTLSSHGTYRGVSVNRRGLGDAELPVLPVVAQTRHPLLKVLLGLCLEVVNALLIIQINAAGLSLDGHDRQTKVHGAAQPAPLYIYGCLCVLQDPVIQSEETLVPALQGPFAFLM